MEFKGKKIMIVHHNDGDGICSAAIFALTLKKLGNFPVAINAPEHVEFGNVIRNEIQKVNPEFLVILDLPLQYIDSMGLPFLAIDHHPLRNELEKNGEIIHDTKYCAAYLTYRYCEKLADIKDLAWIGAVGCLSDKDIKGFNELFELSSEETGLTKEDMQKMMGAISSSKVLGQKGIHYGLNALIEASNMGLPTAVLGSTPNAQKLKVLKKISRKERDYWLLFHKDFAKMGKELIFYKINTQLPVQSYLAGTLANLYPKHVCLVASDRLEQNILAVEGRTKEHSFDLGAFFDKMGKHFGGSGGGLKSAAGLKIPIGKEKELLEEINKNIK